MRVYLASSFDLIERVQEVATALEEAGHTITVKWWDRVYDIPGEGRVPTRELKARDEGLDDLAFYSRPETRKSSEDDIQGVLDSDVLILVADEKPRKFNGANIELGIAIGVNLILQLQALTGGPYRCYGLYAPGPKLILSLGRLEISPLYLPVKRCQALEEVLELLGGF